MQLDMKTSPLNWKKLTPGLLLLALAVYLVAAHYIKAYSDPSSYVLRAERLGEGILGTRRPLAYPAMLWVQMLVLGGDAVGVMLSRRVGRRGEQGA